MGAGTLFRLDPGQRGVIKNLFNGAFVAAIFVTGMEWNGICGLGSLCLQEKVPISSGLTIFRTIFYFCHG